MRNNTNTADVAAHEMTSPTWKDLVFPLQRDQYQQRNAVYERIRLLDDAVERGTITSFDDSAFTDHPFLTCLTLLYGPWRCNFSCPRYCYTKGMSTRTLMCNELRQLIEWATLHGAQFSYWPGVGEVTLFPDFWHTMEYQASTRLPAIVFTNGSVFVDESLCQSTLGMTCAEVLEHVAECPSLHLYVKVWSSDPACAREMTGTHTVSQYPYTTYQGISCPLAFAVLHERFGSRIGMQCMVTQRNYEDYRSAILPFCATERIPLFAEPLILSGNAHLNSATMAELLTASQTAVVGPTFASGGGYCRKRQFGEFIVVGDQVSPGIAIPPRTEDALTSTHGRLHEPADIYFNDYFRRMRTLSDQVGECLCRKWNHDAHA